MKYFLIIIFLLVIRVNSNATVDPAIDSLELELEKAEDTNRVNLLNKISIKYLQVSPLQCIEYAKKAIEASQELNFTHGTIKAYQYYGLGNQYNGNSDEALLAYNNALKAAESIGDKKSMAQCFGSIGIIHREKYNFKLSTRNFEKALQLYEELGDEEGKSICYINVGNAWDNRGDYEEALQQFFKALAIAEKTANYKMVGSCLNNISIIYQDQGDHEKALEYLLRAADIHKKNKQQNELAGVYNNIGMSFQNDSELDKAEEYFTKSLEIRKELNNQDGIAIALNNLGAVCYDRKDFRKALNYFSQAFEIASQLSNKKAIAKYQKNISDALRELGDFDKAIELAENSLEIAQQIEAKDEIRDIHHALSKAWKAKNNYEEAYRHFVLYNDVKDSVFNENTTLVVEEMKARYESERKEQQILMNEQEIELLLQKQKFDSIKIYTALSIIILLLVIGTLVIMWQINKVKKNRLIVQKEKELMEADLKNKELEKRNLENELDYKNREIVNFGLHIVEKNDFLDKLRNLLNEQKQDQYITEVKKMIDFNLSLDKDREEFRANVEQVNESFFLKLSDKFPNLTKNEKRLCALLRLNLSSKEISSLLNISPSSVDMNRHRLRKKLDIEAEENLTDVLNSI